MYYSANIPHGYIVTSKLLEKFVICNITAITGWKECQMKGNWSERYFLWSRWEDFKIREPWSNASLSLMNELLMLMTVSTKCS